MRTAILAGFFALALVALVPTDASAQTNTCTSLGNGTVTDVTAHGQCRRITNSSGLTVCATTGVAANWTGGNSFTSNPPSGVSVASCPTSCSWAYASGSGVCFGYAACGANPCPGAGAQCEVVDCYGCGSKGMNLCTQYTCACS